VQFFLRTTTGEPARRQRKRAPAPRAQVPVQSSGLSTPRND